MTLSFMADASNVMLVGPNGVGKSMLACNLGHQALIQGHTVLFIAIGSHHRNMPSSMGMTRMPT